MHSDRQRDESTVADIAFDLLALRYLDCLTSEEENASLRAQLAGNVELRKAFVGLAERHGIMREIHEWSVEKLRPLSEHEVGAGSVHVPTRDRRIRRWVYLALAASLAIVVGGWWLVYDQQPPQTTRPPASPGSVDMELELRVAELMGEVSIQHATRNVQDSTSNCQQPNGERNGSRAVVGQELRLGDRVVVPEGGKAVLKYEGEETTLALHSGVATLGAAAGAKRVKLESGLVICAVAPQKNPFLLETPHGVATVVGTRFALDAGMRETTLSVREGTVVLSRDTKRLQVKAGGMAVADESNLRTLSSEDAWFKELVMRAEGAPWDAVDFGKGVFAQGDWRMDGRGSPAERLLWNVNPDSRRATGVAFDVARWERGVLMGAILFSGDGMGDPVLSGEEPKPNPRMSVFGMSVSGETANNPIRVMLYRGPRDRVNGGAIRVMEGKSISSGVWHKLIVYFDMAAEGGPAYRAAFWPEEGGGVPAASEWKRGQIDDLPRGAPVGFGLVVAPKYRVVLKGLKFVPSEVDLPQPSAGL